MDYTDLNGPRHDLAPASAPSRTVLVASTRRCGSTLLSGALAGTGRCGVPHEYFNLEHMVPLRARGAPAHLRHYVHWLRQRRTTPNGVFSVKAHYRQLEDTFVHDKVDPRPLLAPLRAVWIRRRDRVRQAVSAARAAQTEQWSKQQRSKAEPHYQYPLIALLLQDIVRQEQAWPVFFQRMGVTPVVVHYDALSQAYAPTVRGVCAALGLGGDVTVVPPVRTRMSGGQSAAWARRFRVEAAKRGIPSAWFGPQEPDDAPNRGRITT